MSKEEVLELLRVRAKEELALYYEARRTNDPHTARYASVVRQGLVLAIALIDRAWTVE